jgi:SpoVK/Ycf46/Vps4 family AAA+-type ATPase
MQTIRDKIRAGYPGLFLLTHEEGRAEAMLTRVAAELSYQLFGWSITVGRFDAKTGEAASDEADPMAVLDAVTGLPEKSLLILRDFHAFFAEPNPLLFRKLKDALLHAKTANKTLILLGSELKLPPEVEKLISVVELALPSRAELRAVLVNLCEQNEKLMPENEDAVLDALGGLTTHEAEDALSLSIIEAGEFAPAILAREKANVVKKNGLLELVEGSIRPEDIGGLEILKEDLLSKRDIFTQEARDYGLPSPRGILACGQPGTGKSLTAQATGSIFNVPLLRLEAGKLFGSMVGESERNWRTAFATARAIAPCILWVDEVDGLFSGAQSSGSTDGGTTNRVIKAILQDMQFNGDGIFFMFTANDIDGIPDPLIDRLDVWSVDLPTQEEREAIWSIHILKRKRDPKKFHLPGLAKLTEGYSGRQIEQVWLKALTTAFNDSRREPEMQDIAEALKKFVPTNVTMGEVIEARRKRLANRATPASRP